MTTISYSELWKNLPWKKFRRNLFRLQCRVYKAVTVSTTVTIDGYYAQFCIDTERLEKREPTGKTIGLDVGLNHFYTDSNGQTVENPRFLRKSERALKRAQKRLSRTKKADARPSGSPTRKAHQVGSKNRIKARGKLGRKHLRVSRQRKDFAVKTARCVVQSNDLVAYEDLKVRNMVKNHHLAKSISDASWSLFRQWVEYFGKVFGVVTVAVPPHYTSQNCVRFVQSKP
jgi:putative transposase